MKSLRISILAMSLAAAPAWASDMGPQPVPAAAETFTLGEFRITSLRDAVNVVPNDGSVFGVDIGPKAVAEVLSKAGQRTEAIELSVDALLVRKGSEAVVIDTGLGPAVPGSLVTSLRIAGATPDEVTTVLITHVHSDHVGGLVTSEKQSAFKHAVIKISEPDWKWLQQQPEMADLTKVIASQVETFTPGEDVAAGIKSIRIPGHTPGHVGYMISSKGETLLDVGDTIHSSIVSLAKPDWAMGYDSDLAVGRTSRHEVLTQLAADHQLIFAPHFPYPGVGWIVSQDDHFAWSPKK